MSITRAQAKATMRKCQRGVATLDSANNTLAECYGTIGALIALVDSLQSKLAHARLSAGGYQPLPGPEPAAPPPKPP